MTWMASSQQPIDNVSNYEAELERLKLELIDINSQIAYKKDELSKIDSQLNERINAEIEKISVLEKEYNEKNQKAADLLVSNAAFEQSLKIKQDEIEKGSISLRELTESFESNIAKRNDELNQREVEINEKLKALDEIEKELSSKEDEINKASFDILQAKNELDIKEKDIEDKKQKSELIIKESNDILLSITKSKEESSLLLKQINELNLKIEADKTQLDQIKTDLARKETDLEEKSQQVKNALVEQHRISLENSNKSEFLRTEEQRIKQENQKLENLKNEIINKGAL